MGSGTPDGRLDPRSAPQARDRSLAGPSISLAVVAHYPRTSPHRDQCGNSPGGVVGGAGGVAEPPPLSVLHPSRVAVRDHKPAPTADSPLCRAPGFPPFPPPSPC